MDKTSSSIPPIILLQFLHMAFPQFAEKGEQGQYLQQVNRARFWGFRCVNVKLRCYTLTICICISKYTPVISPLWFILSLSFAWSGLVIDHLTSAFVRLFAGFSTQPFRVLKLLLRNNPWSLVDCLLVIFYPSPE